MDIATTTADVSFPTGILWGIWTLALLVYLGVSVVLVYHWRTYSTSDPRMKRMMLIYFLGGLALFIAATVFIVAL